MASFGIDSLRHQPPEFLHEVKCTCQSCQSQLILLVYHLQWNLFFGCLKHGRSCVFQNRQGNRKNITNYDYYIVTGLLPFIKLAT